ncbi:MAG: M23 family metallopeptidase [Polyangiaceae bacterium]|nr:M23 family metallopeptidase [Polyangiaceae bacterium]
MRTQLSILTLGLAVGGCALESEPDAKHEASTGGTGGSAVSTGGGWSSGGAAGAAGSAGATGSGGAAGAAGSGGAAGDTGIGGTGGTGATGGSPSTGGTGGTKTNDCPRVEVSVAAGATLNVRPTPATSGAAVGTLANGDIVDVLAQVQGEAVSGNTLWFQIPTPKGYISAAFASCTLKQPPVVTTPDGYYLPLKCGTSAKIAQGNDGSFSHQGKAFYAYDFSIPLGTPMVAMADGVVKYLYDKTGPGDPCYNGGGSSCYPYANYVVLKHGDGKLTTYKHLNKVSVTLGQKVKRGSVIGLSGSTGYSTGPHAHVMRMDDCGQYSCQSIPLKFVDVGGDHVPNTGQVVTSGNCP